MIISWLGLSCFKIQTKEALIITNPFDPKVGIKLSRLSANLVIVTDPQNPKYAYTDKIKNIGEEKPPFIINGSGEYEVKNSFIRGIAVYPEEKKESSKTIYFLETEGISLAFLGGLNRVLENSELENLEGADILMIPVGGQGVLNFKEAAKVISQVEPRMVIPMEYKIPGLKFKSDPLSNFSRELAIKESTTLPKIKISTKDLPQEGTKIILLAKQ